ncbi:MAG: hypothetical protein Q9180_000230 [Flavoplaca navasiana]
MGISSKFCAGADGGMGFLRTPAELENKGAPSLIQEIDRYDLRKYIDFSIRIVAAHYSDNDKVWTITNADGLSTTCRYFLPATGVKSIPKEPAFAGLKSYTGEWYQASKWPAHKVDFHGKRIAVAGTGSTGVNIIPKLAPAAKKLMVFQRTPNYVLPGRNYTIDDYQAAEIRKNHDATWELATMNLAGHACKASGKTVKDGDIDDIFMDPESNEQAADFIRQKIRAIVHDPKKAELLCPNHPFGSKRPPSGHFYFEAFNRPNVKLIDISGGDIELYENGIRTSSGVEYEVDMIIFALGYNAGTGALNEIEIEGSRGKSLRKHWMDRIRTFTGILVSDFPNMFIACGPHMPIGNQPTMLELAVDWIGKTIRHMEDNKLTQVNVTDEAVDAWSAHAEEIFNSAYISGPAVDNRSWFVDANTPGKRPKILFYFGGVQSWKSWLDKEIVTTWASTELTPRAVGDKAEAGNPGQDKLIGGVAVTSKMLESAVVPLQSDDIGLSPAEKFNSVSAACARYIDWAVKEIHDGGLAIVQDHRLHWWEVLNQFVTSNSGRDLIQESPDTKDKLDKLTSKLGVEGEAVARIGPELVRMLTGKTTPLFYVLEDNLLFRMYLSDEGARPSRYLAEYTKMLTSQRKDLRILEVGAGTGGTTFQIFQACSPDGESFCSEYMYTDISHGFFKTGESTMRKWKGLLTFKTLNVEMDAATQGFEEHAYDLIMAANVVHATKSLTNSLGTIHRLLKPGGVLGLVELTRLTPYFNMAFGSLAGWWLGADEGRTESPLQSTEQWDAQLQKAGFSGVDLAAYDLPEPERHTALLLSTARPSAPATNGVAPPATNGVAPPAT